MTSYFDPFGAKTWHVVRFDGDDDVALYVPGRCNHFGTTLAARGTRVEIEQLARDRLLIR